MKPINKAAQKTFEKLTAGLANYESRKIKNNDAFMAVSVQHLQDTAIGQIFSVSHYYTQNGDLMADPDMTFLKSNVDDRVYPMSFRQDGGFPINQQSVILNEDGTSYTFRPRTQRDHATFAGQWMKNIKNQQY